MVAVPVVAAASVEVAEAEEEGVEVGVAEVAVEVAEGNNRFSHFWTLCHILEKIRHEQLYHGGKNNDL